MARKQGSTKQKAFIIVITMLLIFSISLNFYLGLTEDKRDNLIIESNVIKKGNITYKEVLENYYHVEYSNSEEGLSLEIKNPCISVWESSGLSMKPYWDNNTLGIFDTCYPKENLKVGDIIVYKGELDSTINPHHRIIDIDYDKRWVKTQGDNPETNSEPDDFVGFDRIIGKEIGVLNVLKDKKIVEKEIINDSDLAFGRETFTISGFIEFNQTCVCSSSGFLHFCHQNKTILEQDTFIQQNDLREEYCND